MTQEMGHFSGAISLGFYGNPHIDSGDINLLNLNPYLYKKMGEETVENLSDAIPKDVYQYKKKYSNYEAFEATLNEFLLEIENEKTTIQLLSKKYTISIRIFLMTDKEQFGFSINEGCVQKLLNLGLKIDFSFINC